MQTFLSIILFIISLSLLIMIHELGHLTAAKVFRVYVDDYSIGFGPAFFHKKRKKGETYFSLRVVPFGGFISIAEEEGEMPSGFNVPKERSLAGTKKWKTAIIMASGVAMNFILAFVLLLASNVFFETRMLYSNCITVESGSIAETSGVKSSTFEGKDFKGGDLLVMKVDPRNQTAGSRYFYYDTNSLATYEDGTTKDCIAVIQESSISYNSDCSFSKIITYYEKDESGNANYQKFVDAVSKNDYESSIVSMTFNPVFYHGDETKSHAICSNCHREHKMEDLLIKDNLYYCPSCDPNMEHSDYIIPNSRLSNVDPMVLNVVNKEGKYVFEEIGLSLAHVHYKNSIGEAFRLTGQQYAEGTTLIFTTLGRLFIGQGWENTGSIIAVYTQSANILSGLGFGYYLYYWGIISINLGIVNLLPFPGLDGWQLLVLLIEGISRKKIPTKAKTIMSYIGLGLLFALMAALIIKDVVMLF